MLLSILGADVLRKHFQEVQMVKVRNAIFVIIYALIKLFFRSFCMNTVRIQILLNRCFEESYQDAHWRRSQQCNSCDFISPQAGSLRTHLTTHSGENPNKCIHCDFTSIVGGNLKKHLTVHSGELERTSRIFLKIFSKFLRNFL